MNHGCNRDNGNVGKQHNTCLNARKSVDVGALLRITFETVESTVERGGYRHKRDCWRFTFETQDKKSYAVKVVEAVVTVGLVIL